MMQTAASRQLENCRYVIGFVNDQLSEEEEYTNIEPSYQSIPVPAATEEISGTSTKGGIG
jgi:hypothetical protein